MNNPTALVFAVIGGGMVVGAGRNAVNGRASRRWPVVSGQMISSEVTSQRTGMTQSHRGGVEYQYVVDGVTYTGDRIAFGTRWSLRKSSSEALISRYPVGATVSVSHHPTEPSFSVLEPGVQSAVVGGQALFGLVGTIGALVEAF